MSIKFSISCFCFSLILVLSHGIESPQFTVVHTESDFEIRLYRESAWMSAPVRDISFEKATKVGFHRLYQYIRGANTNSSKLVMTAPILTSITPEAQGLFQYIQGANLNNSRVQMTSPVLTSVIPSGPFHSSSYSVKFYLPMKFQGIPPLPLPELNLQPITSTTHCVAVRKFSGFARDSNIVNEAEKLAVSLRRSQWAESTSKSAYGYSIAQYNSPFRVFNRVNEVWVDMDGSKVEGCESDGVAAY